MDIVPILSTVILVATIITFIVAITAYLVFRVREKRRPQGVKAFTTEEDFDKRLQENNIDLVSQNQTKSNQVIINVGVPQSLTPVVSDSVKSSDIPSTQTVKHTTQDISEKEAIKKETSCDDVEREDLNDKTEILSPAQAAFVRSFSGREQSQSPKNGRVDQGDKSEGDYLKPFRLTDRTGSKIKEPKGSDGQTDWK